MKYTKIIRKMLIISMVLAMAFACDTYAVEDTTSTKMQVIGTGSKWVNVTISESYTECESLNSLNSTLATTALQAHLTTDYDWNAMAIFSVSQYGATTTNLPTSTTNNKSGIYETGERTQTTALLHTFNGKTGVFEKLYDDKGVLKKYINKIDPATGIEYDSNNNPKDIIATSHLSKSKGRNCWLV